ncbi:hypothetical protein DIPPA_03461 [Diplonema papillatum]|nr:hypothetical protein DIPPA_03461 [Diplonema papillatum]
MTISTAPKQGEGATEVPASRPVDVRLMIAFAIQFLLLGILFPVVITDVVKIEINGQHLGSMNLWRLDLNGDVLANTGTEDENDPTTTKAILIHHAANDRLHRNVNEGIIAGYQYCQQDTARVETLCNSLRSLTKMFLVAQSMLLPSISITFALHFIAPLNSMRTRNQALLLAIFAFMVAILLIATVANITNNLEDHMKDILQAAYPGISVSTSWRSAAITMFIALGFSVIGFLAALAIFLVTRNDPYPPGDGPNFNQDDPMPVHFLPENKRKKQSDQPKPATQTEPVFDADTAIHESAIARMDRFPSHRVSGDSEIIF